MSRISRVLLMVAALALAAFALLELPRQRASEHALEDARRLFPAFAAPADRVDIVRPEGATRLEVHGTHWEVVSPIPDAAEYSRIATLMDAVSKGEVERNLGHDEDLARFGLAPPASTVIIAAGADTLAYLELGSHTIDHAFVYARRRDGDVVLVAPSILAAATLPLDAYRDGSLVRFDPAALDGFTIRHAGYPDVRWNRRGDSWYTVADGDTIAGDTELVLQHVRRFRGMRVRSFVDPADTAGVFSSPVGSVTLYKRPPAPPVTIRFAAPSRGVFWARTDGASRVVEVHGDIASALDASPEILRDRCLLHFSPARARRIRLVAPDTSAVLVRVGDKWALPNPALGRIDARAAGDFVRALRALRYSRVVDATAADVEPAAFTLVVEAEGDTILDEMRGRPHDPKLWIVTSRSGGVYAELPEKDLNAVMARLRRLRTQSP
jgi:hypothetical protein